MAYTCVVDPSDVKFVLLEFYKTVFKIGEANIDIKVYQMFQNVYERFYGIVQKCRKRVKLV